MSDITIWAIKSPYGKEHEKYFDKYYENVKNGIAQFGWSYIEGCDLIKLKDNNYRDNFFKQNESALSCWKKSRWMLDVKKGDWIVYINVRKYGHCIAAEVSDTYFYIDDKELLLNDDKRHALRIDPNTIVEFDRDNDNVFPIISRKLKGIGSHYRIYANNEFFKSIEQLKNNKVIIKEGDKKIKYYTNQSIEDGLETLTAKIQNTCPGKNLEEFLADIFRQIPNIEAGVDNNGLKGGTDNGADIIIRADFDIAGLKIPNIIVVQVKSYVGKHSGIDGVNQLKNAIKYYKANAGILITTGEATEELEEAMDKLNSEIDESVLLMSGTDVARFVLKYNQNNY